MQSAAWRLSRVVGVCSTVQHMQKDRQRASAREEGVHGQPGGAADARAPAGGLIMSASHNPGGPEEDWGIKFNYRSGEPAPERITDAIFGFTQSLAEIRRADIPDTNLSAIGASQYGNFEARLSAPLASLYLHLFPLWCSLGRTNAAAPDAAARADACRLVISGRAQEMLSMHAEV